MRMLWIPIPEFADRMDSQTLRTLLRQGKTSFILRFSVDFWGAFSATSNAKSRQHSEEIPDGTLSYLQLLQKGYLQPGSGTIYPSMPPWHSINCDLRILPRPMEETTLLQQWYLEIPTTKSSACWTMEHIFAHPFHALQSPWKMDVPGDGTGERPSREAVEERKNRSREYRSFFADMETRTPELESRIARTKELEAEIVRRASDPDSTISLVTMEFVQLRGLLVDLRYAEDDTARDAAFDTMLAWLKTAEHQTLWVDLLDSTGLDSLQNQKYFPSEWVQNYREKLREAFPKNTTDSVRI